MKNVLPKSKSGKVIVIGSVVGISVMLFAIVVFIHLVVLSSIDKRFSKMITDGKVLGYDKDYKGRVHIRAVSRRNSEALLDTNMQQKTAGCDKGYAVNGELAAQQFQHLLCATESGEFKIVGAYEMSNGRWSPIDNQPAQVDGEDLR